MSVNMNVRPDTYFRNHAQNNRAPNQGREISAKLPAPIEDWIGYAETDLGGNYNKLQVASLALMFGASRPHVSWGYPVNRFDDITQEVLRREMEGELLSSVGFGPMNTRNEYQVNEYPQTMRVPQQTMDLLDNYQSFLRTSRSVAARHLMAISFRWYTKEVYDREEFEAMSQKLDPYVDRIRKELDSRIRYAAEELDMNIQPP